MGFDKFAPRRITNLGKLCGGIGNISEHHRRQHTISLYQVPLAALPKPGADDEQDCDGTARWTSAPSSTPST